MGRRGWIDGGRGDRSGRGMHREAPMGGMAFAKVLGDAGARQGRPGHRRASPRRSRGNAPLSGIGTRPPTASAPGPPTASAPGTTSGSAGTPRSAGSVPRGGGICPAPWLDLSRAEVGSVPSGGGDPSRPDIGTSRIGVDGFSRPDPTRSRTPPHRPGAGGLSLPSRPRRLLAESRSLQTARSSSSGRQESRKSARYIDMCQRLVVPAAGDALDPSDPGAFT